MYNFFVIILVLIIYAFFCSSKRKFKNADNYFLITIFIIFFFMVGYRSIHSGNDTIAYITSFKQSILYKWDYLNISRFEKGFLYFQILLGHLTTNVRIYLLILSAIFNYVVYKFIKNNSKNYLLSVIMYVCLLHYYSSMTMIRQFFAMILILHSFSYVKEKKLLPFIVTIIVATQFHVTAAVCILLYPMYNIDYNNKRALGLFFISVLVILFIIPIMNYLFTLIGWQYAYDIRIEDYSLANTLYTIIYFIMFLLAKSIIKKSGKTSENNFYLYVFLVSTLLNLISIKMNTFARVADYYTIFTIVALPNVIKQLPTKKTRINFEIVIFLIMVIYSTVITILRPEWNSAFNYKVCFYDSTCNERGINNE